MLVFLIQIDQITLILSPACDASLLLCDFLQVVEFCSTLLFWFHMKDGANLPISGQYFLINLRVHNRVSVEEPAANKGNSMAGKIIPILLVAFLPYKSQIT